MAEQNVPGVDPQVQAATDAFRRDYRAIKAEIAKAIVGHEEIVDGVLTCLFVGGHALLEGVPGLGKTALIRALAEALHLKFSRIQFTPDLMPADVIGTNVIMENEQGHRAFQFMHGPIFAQIVLADEINRATPKTQSRPARSDAGKAGDGRRRRSASSKSRSSSWRRRTRSSRKAPIRCPKRSSTGSSSSCSVQYSGRDELREILDRTTTGRNVKIQPVLDGERIKSHQQLIRRVVVAPHVQDYAIRCTLATHPQRDFAIPMVNQFLRVGASPAPRRRSRWRARSGRCWTAASTSASRTSRKSPSRRCGTA